MKKTSILFLIFVMFACSAAFAEEPKKDNPPAPAAAEAPKVEAMKPEAKSPGLASGIAEKFGRGLSNIAFSIFEFPYRIGKEMEVTDPIAALGSGALKGVAWAAARLVVGAFDTVTFFIPTRPMIREFDAGWWAA